MIEQVTSPPATLYERDETSWLEQTANLLEEHRLAEVDLQSLCEFLTDMAQRDRREVFSRLRTLLTHLLKWEDQPENRGTSWRGTIRMQRSELRQLFHSGTLRRHAEQVLAQAYGEAIEQAADETGLPATAFPAESSMSLDDLLTRELEG